MKKKLIGFSLAFALALSSGAFLTACDDGDDSPYLQDLVIERNGATYQNSATLDYGEFPVDGSGPVFNHTVYAKYSDGNKQELSAAELTYVYSFRKPNEDSPQTYTELPATYSEIGYWYVSVIYQNNEDNKGYIQFSIVPKQASYVISGKTNITYPEKTPVLGITDETAGENDVNFYYIEQSKVANVLAPTEEELDQAQYYFANQDCMKPGNYYVYANVAAHGKFAAGRTALKAFNVAKGNLKITGYDKADYSRYKYDFNYIQYADEGAKLKDVKFVSDNTDVDDRNLTNNGVYIKASIDGYPEQPEQDTIVEDWGKISFNLKFEDDEKTLNYTEYGTGKTERVGLDFGYPYKDGTYGDYFKVPSGWGAWDATVTVERGEIEIPKLEIGGNDNRDLHLIFNGVGYTDFFEIEKDGDPYTPKEHSIYNKNVLLDTVTAVGNYNYKLILKDKVNYAWKIVTRDEYGDVTSTAISTDDRQLTWAVEELDITALQWKCNGVAVENGHAFTVSESSAPYLDFSALNFPENVGTENNYLFYKIDGTNEIPLNTYPTEVGQYRVTYASSNVDAFNGHYFVKETTAVLEYSIVADQ